MISKLVNTNIVLSINMRILKFITSFKSKQSHKRFIKF